MNFRSIFFATVAMAALAAQPALAGGNPVFGGDTNNYDNSVKNTAHGGQGGSGIGVGVGIGQGGAGGKGGDGGNAGVYGSGNSASNSSSGVIGSGNSSSSSGVFGSGNSDNDIRNSNSSYNALVNDNDISNRNTQGQNQSNFGLNAQQQSTSSHAAIGDTTTTSAVGDTTATSSSDNANNASQNVAVDASTHVPQQVATAVGSVTFQPNCMSGNAAGFQNENVGLSLGFGRERTWCRLVVTAQTLHGLGETQGGVRVLCLDKFVAKANPKLCSRDETYVAALSNPLPQKSAYVGDTNSVAPAAPAPVYVERKPIAQ